MGKKYKKTWKYLQYVEHLLVPTSAFASLVCVPVGISSSAVGLTIFPITAGIIRYTSIIKKKKKKHDKTILSGKDKLNTIEVLISKALTDSYISQNEFVSVKIC